jgi:hypothetical protein
VLKHLILPLGWFIGLSQRNQKRGRAGRLKPHNRLHLKSSFPAGAFSGRSEFEAK